MVIIMKKCQLCEKELPKGRTKFCTRICSTRFINKKHQVLHNQKARQKLIDNPIEERARRAEKARNWRASHIEAVRTTNRTRIESGIIPNEDEVVFYGYKEPLRKVEGGHGYMGVLSYSKDNDKVQCHLCGLLFRSINNGHLMKVHGMKAAEYKEKVGLAPTTSLVGEGTRLKLIERGWNPNHMEALQKAQQNRRERIARGEKDLQSGKKRSLERYNEKGTCPDQLLDKIDNTIKSFGRVPTEAEFLKFHHGKFMGSIRRTYGTWTNALSYLGKRPNRIVYSEEDLLEAMRNFYRVNNRTPRWSDMERGLLPSANAYYNKFRSLNTARQAAGVPVLIPVGQREYEEVLIPTKS